MSNTHHQHRTMPHFNWLMRTSIEHPFFGGLLGASFSILFVFLWIWAIKDYAGLPSRPVKLEVGKAIALLEKSAGEEVWVTIKGATWNCANAILGNRISVYPVHDPASGRLIVVETNKPHACYSIADKPVTGVLHEITARRLNNLLGKGLDVSGQPKGKRILIICTYAGKGNSLIGVIIAPIFIVLGLCMYPLCRMLHRYYGLG